MISPWVNVPRLDDAAFRSIRRRAIFDYFKWDPQVEDSGTLARVPLVTTAEVWSELTRLGEALARETLALEQELLRRPDLHGRLGLPKAAVAALRRAAADPSAGVARLVRFDFHHTTEGWRISEANSDVPGGLNEASGFPTLVAPHYPGAAPAGDPTDGYIDALLAERPEGARIALLHATAYSDDHQMMAFLARRLTARGARPVLASPAHLTWHEGRAHLRGEPCDLLVRFFPADWLVDLPGDEWKRFYSGSRTPISNPATALLTQSKRNPLLWDDLDTPLPTWRAMLPETRDPREVPWNESDEWVVKPALGRVGEDVGIPGLTTAADWQRVRKQCHKRPEYWVAQRRFHATSADLGDDTVFPCIGVYTVDEGVVGAYGRLAARALVDGRAADAAVLITRSAI